MIYITSLKSLVIPETGGRYEQHGTASRSGEGPAIPKRLVEMGKSDERSRFIWRKALTIIRQKTIEVAELGGTASCAPEWCGVLRDWYVVRLWSQFGTDDKVCNELSKAFRCHMVQEVRIKRVRRRNHTVYQNGKALEEITVVSKFPSFLFVSWDEGDDRWPSILETPGVRSIFRRAGSVAPAKLPRGWLESFQLRGRAGDGALENRDVQLPALKNGSLVRVLDGVWMSWTATVERCRGDEVVAMMTMLGGEARGTFKRSSVELV